MPSKWTEEQKIKALTIAQAVSITEAARQTGIPAGTIKRWRSEANRTEPSEPNHEKVRCFGRAGCPRGRN
ncbi:MAG: transposase [Pelotomaculum sp.]|nr:transposase [Pelotomaculum sp.]